MIYLLCFDKPYKHAKHYLGWCEDKEFPNRLEKHIKGNGARLTAAASKNGISFTLARIWPKGDRHLEKKLKCRTARTGQTRL